MAPSTMVPSMGRSFKDLQNKALGRQPLRYQFEVVPHAAESIPDGVTHCAVVWERGDKIQYVDPLEVDTSSSSVQFRHVMRQNTTLYKEGSRLLPVHCTFKLQAGQLAKGSSFTLKTFGKAKLDLSEFCSSNAASESRKVVLDLQPAGRLHLTITSTWLQHYTPSAAGASSLGDESEVTTSSAGRPSNPDASDDLDPGTASSSGKDQGPPVYAAPSSLQGLTHGPLTAGRPVVASPFSSPSRGSSPGSPSGSTPVIRHSRNKSSGGSCPVILEDLHGELQQPSWTQQARASSSSSQPAAPPSSNSMTSARSARGNTSFTRSLSSGNVYNPAQAPAGAAEEGPAGLRQGGTSVTSRSSSLVTPSAAELAEDPGSSLSRTLSNAIPQWMWPVGRSTVKDMTTEQIMWQIATGADVATLQSIARGLLVERNDWRREACAAQDKAAQLEPQLAHYKERCRELEGTTHQLQESELVDKLVAVKLQLAQADMAVAAHQGDLKKEQHKNRVLAARLTTLESKYERLLNEHQVQQQGEGQGWGASTAAPWGEAVGRMHISKPAWADQLLQQGAQAMQQGAQAMRGFKI